MSYSINQLIEDVKKFSKQLRSDDILSVLWYSGTGQYGVIVKNQIITEKMNYQYLDSLLDKHKSTVGCTVFSEALQNVSEIIKETEDITKGIVVNWFTDGQLVPDRWDIKEEKRLIFLNLSQNICSNPKVFSINTIGYGPYYDRELLEQMASCSKFGSFTHATNISNFFDICLTSIEIVKGITPSDIIIDNPKSNEIYFLSEKAMYFSKEKTININGLTKKITNWLLFLNLKMIV